MELFLTNSRGERVANEPRRPHWPAPTVAVTAQPSATPAASMAGLTNAEAVVTQFCQDITDGSYPAAWALGGDVRPRTTVRA